MNTGFGSHAHAGLGDTRPHPEITVRAIRASDLDRIVELEQELFGVGAWTYSMLADEIGAPGRWYIVAERASTILGAGRVVGYAGLWFDGEVSQIMTIGVSSHAQKMGIGATLMDALFERSKQLGAQALFLEVAVNNNAALAMYKKYGFEQIAVRKRYYQPENLDAYVMRVELEDPVNETDPRKQVFITCGELHARLGDPSLRILDVRWELGRTDGRESYENAHIPGAQYVDLDTELAVHASPERGRHPLPDTADFEQSVRRWGIDDDSTVVVYDAVGGTSAARLWWMLKDAGIEQVRILDGGVKAWSTHYGTVQGNETAEPSTIDLSSGHMSTITIDQAANWAEEGILIDARAHQRYLGEVEPVDPRAGHIPGALNVPTFSHLSESGELKPTEELLATFEEAGVIDSTSLTGLDNLPALDVPVAVYCGSGVTASHEIAVLASLGIEAALFPGSWSQWSNDPSRPAATGE